MNRPNFLFELRGRRSLSVVLASILVLIIAVSGVAPSRASGGGDEMISQLIQTYIQNGKEQIDAGSYAEAEKMFLMAQGYREYLSPAEQEELGKLLEKAQVSALSRKRVDDAFRMVNELVAQEKFEQAKEQLESIRSSQSLTGKERVQIIEVLRLLDGYVRSKAGSARSPSAKTSARTKTSSRTETTASGVSRRQMELDRRRNEIAGLFYRSYGFYRVGEYAKAREGFIKVIASGLIPPTMVRTIEGYVAVIDAYLSSRARPSPVPRTGRKETGMIAIAEPDVPVWKGFEPEDIRTPVTKQEEVGRGGYIEVIKRKRNIIRSHTEAVVEDALNKVEGYLMRGDFAGARKAVDTAELTVNRNGIHLGDGLFKLYSGQLRAKEAEIAAKEAARNRQLQELQRKEAIDARRILRDDTEKDRQRRINELMNNAMSFAQQQRYDAALGQLESLLVLDPYNDDALTLKEELDDMVYFKKEIDLQKEADSQRAATLLENVETGIPYADVITYPKNWREIIEKPTRKPDEPIGLDPVDAAVYSQLEQVVDLSQLAPTMPFSEAIEEIKNSVEPPLKIVVLWRDLFDNAEVESSTEINMDGLLAVPLGTGLENLLKAVSGGFGEDIGFVVENGVVTVATVVSLPSKLETRVYDVTDLVGQSANFQGMGGGMYGGGGGMYGGGGGMYGGGGGGMYGGGGGGMYGGGGGMYGGGGGMYGGGGQGGYGQGGYGGGGYGGGGYGGGGGMYGGGGQGGGGQGGYGQGGYGQGGYGQGGYGGMGGGGGYQAQNLVDLIMEAIEPDSWYEMSDTGEGTIMPYPRQQPKKLVVMQTREVHKKIDKLLVEMRKALGHQVSIETRFLVVSENFLEDIGLDIDFGYFGDPPVGLWTFDQGSALSTTPDVSTKVPGSLGGVSDSLLVQGGYAGFLLDDLQVSLLLRMTQAHTDAKTLTAPKVTVLSGESAMFSVQNDISYALPPDVQYGGSSGAYSGGGYQSSSVQQNIGSIQIGSSLSITPIIAQDKKNVLLFIITQLQDLLRMKSHTVEGPVGALGEVAEYTVTVPETETSQVMTRVSVPDNGTLLLGGQKITAEIDKEAGIPILSKIPLLGRLFSNRSKIRDNKILLILVKPTIILQEEKEAEAIAAMEGEF